VTPPGQGTPPPSAASVVDRATLAARNRASGLIVLVSGLLMVVGSFLPWAEVDLAEDDLGQALIENTTLSGVKDIDGELGEGIFFIVVGVLVAVVGILALLGIVKLALKVLTIVLGVLASLFGLLVLSFVLGDEYVEIRGLGEPINIPTTLQFGLVLVVVGAIGSVIGSFLLKRKAA
jgi:hypothetical protein